MKKNKLFAASALLLAIGLVGCEVSSSVEEEHTHTPASEWSTDNNYHWHACTGEDCKEKLDRAKHTWVDDPDHPDVAATCTEEGTDYSKCSVCGKTKSTTIAALGHQIGDTPTTRVEPTHFEEGYEEFTCTRDGCGEKVRNTLPKGEHELMEMFTLDHEDGYADITVSQCTSDNYTRYTWSAGDVIAGTESQIEASGQGWQFANHPIGNAVENPSSDAHEAVPDETKLGDAFNFKIKSPVSVTGGKLYARLTPSQYVTSNDVPLWKCPADVTTNDWTYGIRFVDGVATPIEDYRYILKINGVEVPFVAEEGDTEVVTATGWYALPMTYDFVKGTEYTIQLTMAGGWLATFFEFGFEEIATEKYVHQHNVKNATEVTGDGKTPYTKGTCSACGVTQIAINALDGTFDAGSSNKSGTPATYLKLNSNGNGISYTFDVEKPLTGKIYIVGRMDSYSGNKNNTMYTVKISSNVNGNFELKVNDTAVDYSAKKDVKFSEIFGADLDTTFDNGTYSSEATVEIGDAALVAGTNTISFKRVDSYNILARQFVIIGEEGEAPANPDPAPNPNPDPSADGIKFEVSNASGYTDSSSKMKSNAVWTVDNTDLPAGKYSVKINAKMTASDHSDRKWYNMSKANLCVGGVAEETRSSSPDSETEDDFRYFMKVNDTVVNPDGKDNWGTIGLTNTEFNTVAFISEVTIGADLTSISVCHGTIGFSLYVAYIEFVATAA